MNNQWKSINNSHIIKNILLLSASGLALKLGLSWFGRAAVNRLSDGILKRIMIDKYEENIWEFVSAATKVGLQNIVETNLRSQEGKVIRRPLGSPKKMPDFNGIMFNFAQLHHLPTSEGTPIDTTVVIGPAAKRPMIISMPIIISGMAFGYALSAQAKIALAKGTELAGTASNSGEGPLLPAERKAASRLIIQYNRGTWNRQEKVLRQGDMLEIHLGQGAAGGLGHVIDDKTIDWKIRRMMGLKWGQTGVIHANFPGITNPDHLKHLVTYLRNVSDGVPIGVKMAPGKYLEKDLEIALNAGVDVIALDGANAGSKGSPPILQDDFGLPTLYALVRAVKYLQQKGVKDRVSLIVGGGLFNPGDFLKAVALGADAVYIGSVALFAMSHTTVLKAIPFEPPPSVVWYKGRFKNKLKPRDGAKNLYKFLKSCNEEMMDGVRALGKKSIHEVSRDDMFALDPLTAEIVGIPLGYKESHPQP